MKVREMGKKYVYTLFALLVPAWLMGQNCTPYGLWHNPQDTNLYYVSIDPGSGTKTILDTLPGYSAYGISESGLSVVDPIDSLFIFLADTAGQDRLISLHLLSGKLAAHVPLNDPIKGLQYHCGNEQIYCLKVVNNDIYFCMINPQTGQLTVLSQLPSLSGNFVPYTYALDPVQNCYTFMGMDSSNYRLITVNTANGSIKFNIVLNQAITGFEYNCRDSLIYGIRRTPQQKYQLVSLNPMNGNYLVVSNLNGLSGSWAPQNVTFNSNCNEYGFIDPSGANKKLFRIKLGAVPVVGSVTFNDQIEGLNEGGCCVECPLPTPNFNWVNTDTTASFTDLSLNGTSWSWNFGDGSGSNIEHPVHTYDSAGTYLVCLKVNNLCGDTVFCDSVTVSCPPPDASWAMDTNMNDLLFVPNHGDAGLYHWDFGDGEYSDDKSPTHTYLFEGYYTPCLTVTNQCGSSTVCDTILVIHQALFPGQERPRLSIFPNPGTDWVQLKCADCNPGTDFQVRIMDATGRVMLNFDGHRFHGEVSLDLRDLPSGIYSVMFHSVDGTGVRKLEIKK